jgi:hypothetical protein
MNKTTKLLISLMLIVLPMVAAGATLGEAPQPGTPGLQSQEDPVKDRWPSPAMALRRCEAFTYSKWGMCEFYRKEAPGKCVYMMAYKIEGNRTYPRAVYTCTEGRELWEYFDKLQRGI